MDIRSHKKRGQWAELRFMTKAIELGFQLAKPLGDTAQYDVVIDLGGRFISVQVKSTFFQASNLKPGNFVASLFHANGPNHRYEPSDFDYFIPVILDLAAWPFNSTTITSIAVSLVFSGKCVVAASYCASPALALKVFIFPSGKVNRPVLSVRNTPAVAG